jgi:hypothetical protein
MPYREGQTATNPQTGHTVVFRGGQWVSASPQGGGGGGSSAPMNSALARATAALDAKRTQEVNDYASGSLSRISEASGLLRELPNTPTGFGVPQVVGLRGAGVMSPRQVTTARSLDKFAGTAAIADAANLKPLSNSDMQFLLSQQAGSGENRETNQRFLRARQWADAKALGYAASRDAWTAKLGSPSAKNPRGMSFDTYWALEGERRYPRPENTGGGDYLPPRISRRPASISPNQGKAKDISSMSDAELRALIARGQ